MAAASAQTEKLLTVRLDGRDFGVPAGMVSEVMRLPRVSRVPHAPASLLGLANVRGAVVPVLSLGRLLLDREIDRSARLVVVNAGEPIGLAVDEVSQVRDVGADEGVRRIDVADLVARHIPSQGRRPARRGTVVAQEAETVENIALVSFAIGGQDFALPLGSVDEVLRLPADIAILPDADHVVVGSAAIRNATLPLLSASALLALPTRGTTNRSRVLVVRIGTHRVGLIVDEMRAILRVDPADVDPVPHALSRGNAEAKIQAICRLDRGTRLVSVLATDHLLRDDITQRLLHGGPGEQDQMDEQEAGQASAQFLLFRIGEEEFGLPIEAVEEVAPLPSRLTPLPKAPAFVQGVMNLRGDVIPVIDQSHRFSGVAATGTKKRVLVVRVGALRAGFIVDAVSEVLRVQESALRPAPDLGTEGTRVFERVANLEQDGRIILIVSPKELLDRAEQDLLRELGRKGTSAAS